MKKLLTVSLASVALAAMADYTPITVGVAEITATSQNTIIPAPYSSLTGGDSIAVKDLVKAANLPEGTMLYYYNGSSFDAWIRSEDKSSWTSTSIVSTTKDGISVAPGADTVSLKPGGALWLVLPQADSYSQKVYVYGAPTATAGSTVVAGTNLVANVGSSAKVPDITGASEGDILSPINTSAFGGYYVYDSKETSWYHISAGKAPKVTTLPSIDQYQGLWYISKGSSGATIAW